MKHLLAANTSAQVNKKETDLKLPVSFQMLIGC